MSAPSDTFLRAARWRSFARGAPALIVIALAITGHHVAAISLFMVVFVIIGYLTLSPTTRLLGPVTVEVPQAEGLLLTFDDGPCPDTTPALLDLLDQYGQKALFFHIGERVQRWPELAQRIVERGHEIGNHTQRHRVGTFWAMGPMPTWTEIAECQDTIEQATGQRPRWFRAPVGHYNLFTHPALTNLGLRLMSWSHRSYDGVDQNFARVLHRLLEGLRPGAILVIHEAMPNTLALAERVLAEMKQRNLTSRPTA